MINQDMPIPGENFTSDTSSYPWHQPPEYSSIAEALDKMSVKLTEKKVARNLMTMADAGIPLVRIAQMIVMEGMARGKWTIDMGLLIAGPITKIIEIMCDAYEIEYTIGIEEDDDDWNTGTLFKAMASFKEQEKDNGVFKIVSSQMDEIKDAAEGQDLETEESNPEGDLMASGFTTMMGGKPSDEGGESND